MKNKKKLIIILLIILVIVAIGTFIIIKNNSKKTNNKIQEFYEIAESEYQYFILYLNNKYGVINSKGDIIIEPNYDKIIIPNPQKAVFVCSNNDNTKNIILNEKKEQLFTIYDNVEAIQINEIVSSLPYEKYTLKYSVNNQYGIIDLDGNRITKAIYEEIEGLKYKEGSLKAKKDGKYGVIDTNGNVNIKFEYDDIEGDKYYDSTNGYSISGYIVMNTTDDGYRYGYITGQNKKLTEVEYNNISRITSITGNDIYLIASKNGQYGLIKNKDVIIDFKYQGIEYNALNNRIIINKSTKYGIYTLDGAEIIPIEYKTLQFNGICVYAKTGDEVKYFTADGNEITNGITSLQPVGNGQYYISINDEGLYGITDANQNTIEENTYIYIDYLFGNYFVAYKKGQGQGIISADGTVERSFSSLTIGRIGDSNLIKIENMENNTMEIYSSDLRLITRLENAELEIKDTYIKLYNNETNIYIDYNGVIIGENEALSTTKEAPDTIGNYTKEYYGYSEIYYTVETDENE